MSRSGTAGEFGAQLPSIEMRPPGPASLQLAERLRAVESRNVTFLSPDFPVFWREAAGANVRDADGNVYVDLTAAFGVALAGHRNARVDAALRAQSDRLVHGMGDVHPPEAKVELLEGIARVVAPALGWSEPQTILGSSGSEAVEAALKTAQLASGRSGVLAFEGGYHGLTLGSLAATGRSEFRTPFESRLFAGVARVPFPESTPRGLHAARRTPEAVLAGIDRALYEGVDGHAIGTVLIEPVQARGGVYVLPTEFAEALMERVRDHNLVLIADEIYTGMGRCGAVVASPRVGLEPHVICLGKVLGGGLPISACVAPRAVMEAAWPLSSGEALHTSTFLGHPMACAAGSAMLAQIEEGLVEQAEAVGQRLMQRLCTAIGDEPRIGLRGLGLLVGLELFSSDGEPMAGAGARVAEAVLAEGVLVLPAGDVGSVIEFSPPAVLTEAQEAAAVDAVLHAVRTELSAAPAE